jgi:hypothetical protein
MTAGEFDSRWRQRISLPMRLAIPLLATFFAIGMRMFGRRRFIARHLGELDELSADDERELTAGTRWESLDELMLDQRDRLLLDAVRSIHDRRATESMEVAVVYGAGHMPALVKGLYVLGYRPVRAEWLTVFSLIDDL